MADTSTQTTSDDMPPLQIHMEPDEPIELNELNASLSAIGRQYRQYAVESGHASNARSARLLVSSVQPGSIDIGLLPALIDSLMTTETAVATGSVVAGATVALTKGKHLIDAASGFAESLKKLLENFRRDGSALKLSEEEQNLTVQDCNDAIAIASPTARHGGIQKISVYNGVVYQPVVTINVDDADKIANRAREIKALLKFPEQEVRQRVPLKWEALPRGEPKTEGLRSPDKGVIEEIDPDPKPVFFTDEYADLKDAILGEHEENPYTRLYFVDVEVSRVDDKVVSYRVTGYHGQTDL